MKAILQVLVGLLTCSAVFGADQTPVTGSQPSAPADTVAQRIFRDRRESAKDVPMKRQLRLSVADLTAVRKVGTSLAEITRVFGRSNLRSIPDDDVLILFYRIEIDGEDRRAFLDQSKLPDVKFYTVKLATTKGLLTDSYIRPAPVFPEKPEPNKPPEAMAVKRPPSNPSPAPAMPRL